MCIYIFLSNLEKVTKSLRFTILDLIGFAIRYNVILIHDLTTMPMLAILLHPIIHKQVSKSVRRIPPLFLLPRLSIMALLATWQVLEVLSSLIFHVLVRIRLGWQIVTPWVSNRPNYQYPLHIQMQTIYLNG